MAPSKHDPTFYHRIFGKRRPAIAYSAADFLDYVVMNVMVALTTVWVFGAAHPLTFVALFLGLFMIVSFPIRRGARLSVPAIVRRPHEIVYAIVYKALNIRTELLLAVCLLLIEQGLIRLTPSWPHNLVLVRQIGLALFYASFAAITLFRTRSLIDHVKKRARVLEVLSQSSVWRRTVQSTGPLFEILHAYASGVLSHITTFAPWYLVIRYFDHSVLFLPVALVASAVIQRRFFTSREFRTWEKSARKGDGTAGERPEMFGTVSSWFYRDHWVGHNSELEFLYLHGTHHDSIPVGLLANGENGHLEGFFRYAIGYPTIYLSPLWVFLELTVLVILNIGSHQYIPGIYPYCFWHARGNVHVLHHFGRLAPYGVTTIGVPELDVALNGYQPENRRHLMWQALVEKYEHGIRGKEPVRLFPPLRVYE